MSRKWAAACLSSENLIPFALGLNLLQEPGFVLSL